jgi:hypothetical protein
MLALVASGGAPVTVTDNPAPSPLFVALVDPIDTAAVLALIAIIPGQDAKSLRSFERKNGGWVEAPDYIRDIQGLTPPPLVELDRESLLAVVEEIDTYDKNQSGDAVEPEGEAPAPEGEAVEPEGEVPAPEGGAVEPESEDAGL